MSETMKYVQKKINEGMLDSLKQAAGQAEDSVRRKYSEVQADAIRRSLSGLGVPEDRIIAAEERIKALVDKGAGITPPPVTTPPSTGVGILDALQRKRTEIKDNIANSINDRGYNNLVIKAQNSPDPKVRNAIAYVNKNPEAREIARLRYDLTTGDDVRKNIDTAEKVIGGAAALGVGYVGVKGAYNVISKVLEKRKWKAEGCYGITDAAKKAECLNYVNAKTIAYLKAEMAKCKDQECADAILKKIKELTS